MTLTVTLQSNPISVSVAGDAINVSLESDPVTISLAGAGPQGIPGPAGEPGADGSSITWSEVTAAAVAMAIDNGYLMNNASRVVGTLPATAPQFGVIRIAGKGAGGWRIAQNAGQTIHFDGSSTTTGAAGYLASQATFDCLDLLVITANTDFLVTSSIGNLTGA